MVPYINNTSGSTHLSLLDEPNDLVESGIFAGSGHLNVYEALTAYLTREWRRREGMHTPEKSYCIPHPGVLSREGVARRGSIHVQKHIFISYVL